MITKLIQPCCAQKQLRELRNILEKDGTAQMEGYGDLSLTELLPALLTRYSNAEMLIAAPSLPDQAAEIIATWMRKQWARMDGCGNVNVIARLTIVSDLSEEHSPMASDWLKDNPFGERLTLVNRPQTETVILMSDFAITGPVNMRYGYHFTATATTEQERIRNLWQHLRKLAEPEPVKQEAPQEDKLPADKTQETADAGSAVRPMRSGRTSRMLK